MKTKTIKGWIVWTRDATPMEDGCCMVYRSKIDAIDSFHQAYLPFEIVKNLWRIAPVTMTCEVPCKPAKCKAKGKRR